MAKIAGRNLDVTLNSVVVEDEITTSTLNVTQESLVTTTLADAGPRLLAGNYDWNVSWNGVSDFAASQGDATIFGLVASAPVAIGWDPTGAEAGSSDPNYDGSVILAQYSMTAAIGQPHTYSVQLDGATALTRAVA